MAGSCFAARTEGISPANTVIQILSKIRHIACDNGSAIWMLSNPNTLHNILLIGIDRSIEIPTPKIPAHKPTNKFSALKTCDIFAFDAPSVRKIPISFVRSITEIWVMIAIIMLETI